MADLEAKMAEAVNDAVEDGSIGTVGDTGDGSTVTDDVAVPDTTGTETAATDASSTATETTKPAAVMPVAEVDELAKELGLKPRADGKENRIPYSRVKSIIAKAQEKAEADHVAKVSEHTTKITAYEQKLQEIAQVEHIMLTEPERFLAMLPSINPAYANFGGRQERQTADIPQPNVELPDGSMTYDVAGWKQIQAIRDREQEARIEKKFTDRFGPIEQSFKSQQLYEAARPKVQAQLAEAAKLPLFKESEAEILKVLQANPSVSLEAAYHQVVLPKLQANRDSMRADILKELQSKPTSTSTASTGGTRTDDAKTLEEKMLDALKAGGVVK